MDTTQNSATVVRTQTGEVTAYKLSQPVTLKDGSTLSVLHLRRPKGREMREIELAAKMKISVVMDIVGRMCGLLPEEVDEIDGADVLEIAGVIAPFLVVGTGETPPA